VNFGSQCAGYLIRGSATGDDDSFFTVGNAPLESATPAEDGRRQFSFVLTASGHRYVHVVAVDAAGMTGEPSNIIELPNPKIMSISPSGGDEGTMVTFFAQVSGDAPLIYDWEFGEAAEPSSSEYPSPTVTLGAPGNYTGYLTVTNALGESSRDFSITVNLVPKWHVSYPHDYSVVADEEHALAVVNGAPAIAYADQTTGRIMYVLAYDPHATVWRPPKAIAYGENPSLEVINGNPAIAYVNSGSVMFIHSTDVKGEYWSNRVEVMSAPYESSSPCLAQVGGYESPTAVPAIAIADRYELKYARAASEDGAAWEEAVILDAAQAEDTIGEAISMKVAGEAPAIAYLTYPTIGNSSEASLKYIRAADELGSAWLAPVVVDGRGTLYARFVSMAVVNGNPAIAYVEDTNQDLTFVRALDGNGESWGSPLVVDSEAAGGWGCSLAVVGGYPAVAFGNGGTFYVRALDEDGNTWGPVELANENGLFYLHLVEVGTTPAISYGVSSDSDIRLAVFY
jgi:PKD repeat protein